MDVLRQILKDSICMGYIYHSVIFIMFLKNRKCVVSQHLLLIANVIVWCIWNFMFVF